MKFSTLRIVVLAAAAVAGLAAGSSVAAPGTHAPVHHAKPKAKTKAKTRAVAALRLAADSSGNLFANGSFEASLTGWQGYNSTLSRVSGGADGAFAAHVALSASATNFSIYPSPRPVTSSAAGVTYAASAWVRTSGAPRKTCLRVREYSSSTLLSSAQACATSSSTWTALPTVSYTTVGAGHSLDAYVYVDGSVKGDSFDVDAISFGPAGSTPVPTPQPTTTTVTTPTTTTTPPPTTTTPPPTTTTPPPTTTNPPPPPPATGAVATGVDNAHIALAWAPVAGATSYRVLRGSLVVGTTSATSFTDTLLWPQTAYTYSIQALSSAGTQVATLAAGASTTALPAGGFPRPFAPTSFWNTPIAPDAALAPNSSALASFFAAHATSPALSIGAFSVPVSEAHPSDSLFTVPCTLYACTLSAFGAFRIPVTAHADPSSDGHLAVYDASTNREWDFWQAKSSGGTWSASAGAAVSMDATGVAPAGTASGNAANLPLLGGLIRPEEIAQGHIDHALVFGLPGIGAGAPVCPATHNASTSSDPNAPREGAHLQLDPSVDVSSLAIPAWAKIVARAMQVYGMYLRDSSGSLGVYAENPLGRGYNPWPSVLGIAAGNDYPSITGIPWSKFRVIAAPDYPNC